MEKEAEVAALWNAVRSLYGRVERLEAQVITNRGDGPFELVRPTAAPRVEPVAPNEPNTKQIPEHLGTATRASAEAQLPPPLPPRDVEAALEPKPVPAAVKVAPWDRSIEAVIGGNWAGWIGAIVFVLGVLFFLKYAWDQGWINITPTMRVVAAIMTGAAISAIGERMHFRKLRALAATLHGTGLAVVMSSFFAAYSLFRPEQQVLGASAAFAGVAITAAIGIVLALHINSIVLAAIAFVGAYLAPIVLNTGADRSIELLTYLGVLAVTGSALSHWRPNWSTLRGLCWSGTFILFILWHHRTGFVVAHQVAAWVALAFYYGCFLLEMVLTLRRYGTRYPELQAPAAVVSMLNTAAAFYMLHGLYFGADRLQVLGVATIVLAGVQGIVAMLSRSRSFGLVSLLQSSALLTLAIPLLLDEYSITFAWLAMAVVLAAAAWQLNIPAARVWALVVLMLALGRLAIFDHDSRRAIIFTIGSLSISRWTMMAIGAAVLAEVMAWMRPGAPGVFPFLEQRLAQILPPARSPMLTSEPHQLVYATPLGVAKVIPSDPLGIVLALIGTALYLFTSADLLNGTAVTLAWVLWVMPFVALASFGRHLEYLGHAGALMVLVVLRWAVWDEAQPILDHWHSTAAASFPLLNMSGLAGIAILATLIGMLLHVRRQRVAPPNSLEILHLAIAGVVLATVNFQSLRAVDWFIQHATYAPDPANVKQVALSILWALMGFTAIVVGFRRNLIPLRYAALGLLGITLLKILLVDMADVRAVWRILSFIAVGALLLGVSYIYQRNVEKNQAPAT